MNRKLLVAGIIRTMTRHKLRTFFMSAGIVVAVAVLVATRSLGAGAEEAMMESMSRFLSNSSVIVFSGGGGKRSADAGPTTTLTIADLEAIAFEVEGVIAWDPTQSMGGQDVSYRGTTRQVMVSGHSEQAETVWNRGVVAGEYIDKADVSGATRVVLLGTKTAAALFGDEDPIGEQVQIGSAPFRVKGILEPIGMDPHGNDRDDEILVPVTTMMRRLKNVDLHRVGEADGRGP